MVDMDAIRAATRELADESVGYQSTAGRVLSGLAGHRRGAPGGDALPTRFRSSVHIPFARRVLMVIGVQQLAASIARVSRDDDHGRSSPAGAISRCLAQP